MIRVNLVAGEKRAVKSAGRRFDIAQRITVASSLIVVVTLLLIGWRYWALGQHDAHLNADLDAARREEARLGEVLKQVGEFEQQRAQLQQRVALIDELRKGQTAPVHIVDQISRALPEMTWLVTLKQEGYDVTIEGRSTTLSALSDFVGNLEATHYFQRPVEIVETEVVRGDKDRPDLIDFIVKGKFQMAGLDTKPASAAPAGGKKGG
jgi:type IV pilus assembly protein PilN